MKDKTSVVISTLVITLLLIGIVVYGQVLWSKYVNQTSLTEPTPEEIEDPEYPNLNNETVLTPAERQVSLEALEAEASTSAAVSFEERSASIEALERGVIVDEIFE